MFRRCLRPLAGLALVGILDMEALRPDLTGLMVPISAGDGSISYDTRRWKLGLRRCGGLRARVERWELLLVVVLVLVALDGVESRTLHKDRVISSKGDRSRLCFGAAAGVFMLVLQCCDGGGEKTASRGGDKLTRGTCRFVFAGVFTIVIIMVVVVVVMSLLLKRVVKSLSSKTVVADVCRFKEL